MPDQSFKFKQFSIRQNHAAMKVNTDSVLLGAWAASMLTGYEKRLLDIGTGTGLLLLMLMQKNIDLLADAVEVDEEACKDAAFNFEQQSNQINLHCIDFANFIHKPNESYDIIISNPPYFEPINIDKTNNKQLPDAHRSTARFHDSLPFEALALAGRLLNKLGSFFFIIPIQFLQEIETCFQNSGLFKQYYTFVKTLENKEVSRVLCKFGKEAVQFSQDQLILYHQNNIKTTAYQNLVAGYYL